MREVSSIDMNQTCGALEAILFASGDPIELSKLATAVEEEEELVGTLLGKIKEKYNAIDSGVSLVQLDHSFQICTKPIYADAIKAALELKRNTPLTNAAMEVLAIIAYNQPVTRSFVEQIRGVDSSQTVNSLVEKELVEEAGRLDLPGRPISYQTSLSFLRTFGMKSIEELPPLPPEHGQAIMDDLEGKTS